MLETSGREHLFKWPRLKSFPQKSAGKREPQHLATFVGGFKQVGGVREAFKYYFADFVRKGRGYPPNP